LKQSGSPRMELRVFPDVAGGLAAGETVLQGNREGLFTRYGLEQPERNISCEIKYIGSDKAVLQFPEDLFEPQTDVFLQVDYEGDIGNAFIDGRLVADDFYRGAAWEIGLKRFAPELLNKEMYLHISPLRKGTTIVLDSSMAINETFEGEEIANINGIRLVPEYQVHLNAVKR
jgi:hypothetical protein